MENNLLFDTIWIDMDGTLMDWSKGNVRRALIDIEDPMYYITLKPSSKYLWNFLSYLKCLGVSLNVISAIPDPDHCEYVPYINYGSYYDQVCRYKDYTITKYFYKLFDSVHYTKQSDSKAEYVLSHYKIKNPVLIDDMEKYIKEWKESINQYAFQIDEEHSLDDYLMYITRCLEGNSDSGYRHSK